MFSPKRLKTEAAFFFLGEPKFIFLTGIFLIDSLTISESAFQNYIPEKKKKHSKLLKPLKKYFFYQI